MRLTWTANYENTSIKVTAQKMKFRLNCGFGHICWRILNGKPHFLCSDYYPHGSTLNVVGSC